MNDGQGLDEAPKADFRLCGRVAFQWHRQALSRFRNGDRKARDTAYARMEKRCLYGGRVSGTFCPRRVKSLASQMPCDPTKRNVFSASPTCLPRFELGGRTPPKLPLYFLAVLLAGLLSLRSSRRRRSTPVCPRGTGTRRGRRLLPQQGGGKSSMKPPPSTPRYVLYGTRGPYYFLPEVKDGHQNGTIRELRLFRLVETLMSLP